MIFYRSIFQMGQEFSVTGVSNHYRAILGCSFGVSKSNCSIEQLFIYDVFLRERLIRFRSTSTWSTLTLTIWPTLTKFRGSST